MIKRQKLMATRLTDGAVAVPRFIDGFPYPERYCPVCEKPLTIEKATHIFNAEHNFKLIMQCRNRECDFYDQSGANKAYLRVYYSSEYAEENLAALLIRFERLEKK